MTRKQNKTEIAAVVTETSTAVQMMAEALLTVSDEIAIEALDTAILNATLDIVDNVITTIEPTSEVIEDAVLEIEALETVMDPVLEPQADVDGDPRVTFDEVLRGISDEERLTAVKAMAFAVDERSAFEAANGNENIQKTLKKVRGAFSLPSAGAVLLACGVDEAFVNRSVHDGKRYNVYALGKLADAIQGLNSGVISNKINFAIMRSLFAFRKAGIAFTGEMAKAAASDKIRVESAIKAILVRHTVSAVTAPTQASSTMQALETLGIVKREGSSKNPTYTLTDNPAVAKLEEALAKAA